MRSNWEIDDVKGLAFSFLHCSLFRNDLNVLVCLSLPDIVKVELSIIVNRYCFLLLFIDEELAEVQSARLLLVESGLLLFHNCLLYTSPSPRDLSTSRMPSSA